MKHRTKQRWTKLTLALVVALAFVLGWWTVSGGAPNWRLNTSALDGSEPHQAGSASREEGRTPNRQSLASRDIVTGAVSGAVRNQGGVPVASATVTITTSHEVLATARTDAGGRFLIPRSSSWPPKCMARAATAAAVSLAVPVHPEAEIALVLAPLENPTPCTVFGTVRALDTGQPVADAQIRTVTSHTISGSDGTFELATTAPHGDLSVVAWCAGYAEALAEARVGTGERVRVELVLGPVTTFRFQVVDANTSLPIPEAEVLEPFLNLEFELDSAGWCEVALEARRRMKFKLRANGYSEALWTITPEEITGQPIIVPVPRAGEVIGTVTDENGKPLRSCDVRMLVDEETIDPHAIQGLQSRWQTPGRLELTGASSGFASTDAEGFYEMAIPEVASNEPCVITAESDDDELLVPARSPPLVLPAAGESAQVDLALVRGGGVRGQLLRNGDPWRGQIAWLRADGTIGGDAESDENGQYRLQPVPPGPVTLHAFYSDVQQPFCKATVIAIAGRTVQHDLHWSEATDTITGRVLASDGSPLAGVVVSAESDDEYVEARSADDGTYAVTVRTAGRYEVRAKDKTIRTVHQDIAAGATDVDFVALEHGALSLHLVDAATAATVVPSGHVGEVNWRRAGKDIFREVKPRVDEAGMVHIQLPIGTVDIEIGMQSEGFQREIVKGIMVVGGLNNEPVTIWLQRGLDLKVVVDRPKEFAEAMSGHRLLLLERSQQDWFVGPLETDGTRRDSNVSFGGHNFLSRSWTLFHQMLRFDEQGRADLIGLAPGEYRFVVFPDDIRIEPEWVRIRHNEELSVEWESK